MKPGLKKCQPTKNAGRILFRNLIDLSLQPYELKMAKVTKVTQEEI